jgi:putative oxidoreductase
MNRLSKLQPLALLLLRWTLGLTFFYHGWPKLFGKTEAFVESFARMGLPAWTVYLAGVIELFGGVLLAVGLFTRMAGLLLTLHMGVALWKFSLVEGLLAVREYEFPLALAASAFVLASTGAGLISLDRAIFRDKA